MLVVAALLDEDHLVDTETSQLHRASGFAGAPFNPAMRDEIERRDAFRHARGMIETGRHAYDAVADADFFRALRAGGQKNFRRGRVGIFLEEMMLDLPQVVDAKPVGEFDLIERVAEQLYFRTFSPRARQLVLVEQSEFQRFPPAEHSARLIRMQRSCIICND